MPFQIYSTPKQSLTKWLTERAWLSFFQPRYQKVIKRLIETGWKPLFAFAIASILAYPVVLPTDRFCFPESPPFLSLPDRGQDWLDFRSRKLSFVGRSQELEELEKFLNAEAQFSWWWLNGAAGTGKSRLALEWIVSHSSSHIPCLARGYDVGLFHDVGGEDYWRFWQPRRPTVIVIDDAAEHTNRILDLLKDLGQRAKGLAHPVRVLLVERAIPENLKQLDEKELFLENRYTKDPLKLNPLGTGDLEKLASEVALLRNRSLVLTDGQKLEILKVSQGRPLFMIWAIDNLIENNGVISWKGSEDILKAQTVRTRAKFLLAGLQEQCIPLVAMATLTRRLSWETAKLFVPDSACEKKHLFDELYGQDTTRYIPALEPDLLGEYFVLEEFKNLTEPRQRVFLDSAWEASPKEVAQTLYKIGEDFKEHFQTGGIDWKPTKSDSQAWWGQVRVWLLSKDNLPPNDIHHYWKQLTQLAQDHPSDIMINRAVVLGAAWAIRNFGKLQMLDDMQRVQDTLESVSRHFANNPEIQAGVSMGLAHGVGPYGRAKRFDEMKKTYEKLESTAKLFPAQTDLQAMFAMGTVNAINHYAKSPYSGDIPRIFEQMRLLSHRSAGNASVQLYALLSTAHAVAAFGSTQSWTELESAFAFAKTIADEFKDYRDFQLGFATVNTNTIHNYGTGKLIGKLTQPLNLLNDIGKRFTRDQAIQEIVAKGLLNAIVAYRNTTAADQSVNLFWQLRDISARFPKDAEINQYMCSAAANPIIPFYKHKQDTAKLEEVFRLVTAVGEAFPGEVGIRLDLSSITADMVAYYADQKQVDKIEQSLSTLRSRTAEFPANINFQVLMIAGLSHAVRAYGEAMQLQPMEQSLKSAREIALKFPEEVMIHQLFAMNLANSIRFYRLNGEGLKGSSLIGELDKIAIHFPNDAEIAWLLATALNQVLTFTANSVEESYLRLRNLSSRFPDNEKVQTEFIGGMINRCIRLFSAKDKRVFGEFEEYSNQSLMIGDRFPTNAHLQLAVAKMTSMAVTLYAALRRTDKLEPTMNTLGAVVARFPDSPEIQSEIVIAGANAMRALLSVGKRNQAEKQLEAIKNVASRFPNQLEMQNKVKQAQELFVKDLSRKLNPTEPSR